MDRIEMILKALDQHSPDLGKMAIRTTDLRKRPEPLEIERKYVSFCEDVIEEMGRGTEDTMRKNFFPDMQRMGFIKRYDAKGNETDPYKSTPVKFVSLSKLGKRFIESKSLDKFFLYSNGIGNLFRGRIDMILLLLRQEEFELDFILRDEYQFFISAVDTDYPFNLTLEECVRMIKKYRQLGRTKQRALRDTLAKDLKPNSKYPKNEQRDYGNWLNEAEQVFDLLRQIVYFDLAGTKLILTTGKTGTNSFRLARSYMQKQEYFSHHKIRKTKGFEVHHIIPLSNSTSQEHFKLLDNWKNMIYIDAYSHALITHNNNKNIILKADSEDLIFKDYSGSEVKVRRGEQVLYLVTNQGIMLGYNCKLLEQE